MTNIFLGPAPLFENINLEVRKMERFLLNKKVKNVFYNPNLILVIPYYLITYQTYFQIYYICINLINK